jgi:hypothetical protein
VWYSSRRSSGRFGFDHCVSVLSKVYIFFLFVLGDLKTEVKRLYVCINNAENSDMGCTLSDLHDFTIVLNIRNIYSYANLITVFLHELTHVIQKPHLALCYIIAHQIWNFKLFPEWNKICAIVMMDTSLY